MKNGAYRNSKVDYGCEHHNQHCSIEFTNTNSELMVVLTWRATNLTERRNNRGIMHDTLP